MKKRLWNVGTDYEFIKTEKLLMSTGYFIQPKYFLVALLPQSVLAQKWDYRLILESRLSKIKTLKTTEIDLKRESHKHISAGSVLMF